ncbi:MAG: hypothetical protein IH804_07415 [Planctomycetes bacterium]|nr:hypothetical protein [Planctomycetota bacterium]
MILTPLPVDEVRLTLTPLFHEPLKLVMSAEYRLAKKRHIDSRDLAGESVLTLGEQHHLHQQIEQLCDRLNAHVLRDYEGTSLDTLRQMVVMGMGIAFLPALYVRSEIHRRSELRVMNVRGEEMDRARQEAESFVSRARSDIQRERDAAITEVRNNFGDLAITAAERVIQEARNAARDFHMLDHAAWCDLRLELEVACGLSEADTYRGSRDREPHLLPA